jgi:hypothetical protein
MLKWNVPSVRARWIYYAATNPENGRRKPRGAKPVECVFNVKDNSFLEQVALLTRDVGEIVKIRRFEKKGNELNPNPNSCEAFGGCPHRNRCALTANEKIAAYMNKSKLI